MRFLIDESPEHTVPYVGLAVFSLMLMFSVTLTGSQFADVGEAMQPAKSVASAIDAGVDEGAYATLVTVGVIPFEESIYYVGELPVHQPVGGRVAGAASEPMLAPEPTEAEYAPVTSPWEALYRGFGGQ